jgi:hypothetical protein
VASTPAGSYPIGITATGGGMTKTTSFTLTVTVTTPPPSGSAGADYQARCGAPGVVRCWAFNTAADLGVQGPSAYGANFGSFNNSGNCGASITILCPTIDSGVAGGPAMKFVIPSQSGANASGQWFGNFSNDLSVQFGENSEFYVQWRQRFSSEFLNTRFAGGGGWKQMGIETGDQPGKPFSACQALGILAQNTFQRGFPQMYHSCTGSASHGPYDPFEKFITPPGDITFQNARPSPYCLYGQGLTNPKTYFPPAGNCFGYFANEWMTFQVRVKTGPRVNNEFTNSYIQFWIAREGQPSELVIDWGPYNLSAGSLTENQRYGKMWLLPYHTGKDSTQVHPEGYTWYKELIVSRQRIADPGAGSGTSTNPPAAPSALVLQ